MDPVDEHRGLFLGQAAVAALDEPSHQPMGELLSYWRDRLGASGAMPRDELLPEELPTLLPSLFLLDRLKGEPLDLVFRLVGTAIVRIEGEQTGRRLSELIPRSGNELLWEHYERALAGEICLRHQTLLWQGKDYIHYAVLLLPMTRSGEAIDSLLGMALYRFAEPEAVPLEFPLGPMA